VKYTILMLHDVDRFLCLERGQTLETQKNPCHAPRLPKSNRTAVGLSRPSTLPSPKPRKQVVDARDERTSVRFI
jgi:hypothetical protein